MPPDAARRRPTTATVRPRQGLWRRWRRRMGLDLARAPWWDATTPGTALGPWLAMTRRRTPQPEPAACRKNVVELSSQRNRIGRRGGLPGAILARQPYR